LHARAGRLLTALTKKGKKEKKEMRRTIVVIRHRADRILPAIHPRQGASSERIARKHQMKWLVRKSLQIEAICALGILMEHDLIGKPVSTFPDHALVRVLIW
jgi:hypothetical protein